MISYGNGVSLGPLDIGDCELIRSWRNQRAVWQWCRQNDLISDITQQGWYEAQNQDRSIHMYMIHSNGMKVGVCGLTSHCPNARRAEFSLYIAPEYQRNGYARAALKTLKTSTFIAFGARASTATRPSSFSARLVCNMTAPAETTTLKTANI